MSKSVIAVIAAIVKHQKTIKTYVNVYMKIIAFFILIIIVFNGFVKKKAYQNAKCKKFTFFKLTSLSF